MWLFQPLCPVFWLPYWPPNQQKPETGFEKNLRKDQQMAIPAFKKFQNRLKPFCECQNVGVHCKQFALQVSTDEIHNAQIDTKLISDFRYIYLSPPKRLPLGIPIKISIIEKIESARGTMGTSPFPSCPARSLFLSPQPPHNKSLPTIQRGLCGGERVYI